MGTTAILLCARLGSSRLPGKHLLDMAGQPAFHWLLSRVRGEFAKELDTGTARLVVATSDEPENRAFERFFSLGVEVFYGPLVNIPYRFLLAARHFGADNVVAVDGDDILCSARAMRMVKTALEEGAEYAATSGLPLGMNSWGFSTDFLARSLAGHEDKILETGWGRIFDADKLVTLDAALPVSDDRLRFTLDYEQDLAFFRRIAEMLGERTAIATDSEIVGLVMDQRIYALNEDIVREYWENFRREQAGEAAQD